MNDYVGDGEFEFRPLQLVQAILIRLGGRSTSALDDEWDCVDCTFTVGNNYFFPGRLGIHTFAANSVTMIMGRGQRQTASEIIGSEFVYSAVMDSSMPIYAEVPAGRLEQFKVAFRLAVNLAAKPNLVQLSNGGEIHQLRD